MKTLTLIAVLLLLLTTLAYPPQATVEARCLRIVDGDTIVVQYQNAVEKVRFISVNTPEREQPGYKAAKRFTTRMVEGKKVRLEFDHTPRDRSRHERVI